MKADQTDRYSNFVIALATAVFDAKRDKLESLQEELFRLETRLEEIPVLIDINEDNYVDDEDLDQASSEDMELDDICRQENRDMLAETEVLTQDVETYKDMVSEAEEAFDRAFGICLQVDADV